MKQYNLLPVEWDYEATNSNQIIKEEMKKGHYFPTQVEGVKDRCGALIVGSIVLTKKGAIEWAKETKKMFPFVKFELSEGTTWGNQTLVQAF